MDKDRKFNVKGRTGGEVFYRIPDTNNIRTFNYGEPQEVTFGELQRLFFSPGGEYLIRNCLIVEADALTELGIEVEPEYFYTEEEVLKLLNEGSLDQLEDALNFAPSGVIEMIQQIAVRTKLFDTRKRRLIFEKTGFNVDGAVTINEELSEENDNDKEPEKKVERKAAPLEKPQVPERKAATLASGGKYKIVEKK